MDLLPESKLPDTRFDLDQPLISRKSADAARIEVAGVHILPRCRLPFKLVWLVAPHSINFPDLLAVTCLNHHNCQIFSDGNIGGQARLEASTAILKAATVMKSMLIRNWQIIDK